MRLKKFTTFIVPLLFLIACSGNGTKNRTSRVAEFVYGEYYDTVSAMLYGEVFQHDAANPQKSLLPSGGAEIVAKDTANKIYKIAFTDSGGLFSLNFSKGIYNLIVSKDGYRTIKITNYRADSAQVSRVKIILEKDYTIFEKIFHQKE